LVIVRVTREDWLQQEAGMRPVVPLIALLFAAGIAQLDAGPVRVAPPLIEEQAAQSQFVGTWAANVSKSKLDPRSAFKSATLQISLTRDTITIASELVNPAGTTQRGTETLRTDGTETRGTLTPGVVHFASWVGPEVLALTAKKGGQLFALITYEVSADGKTLTTRSSGIVEQVVVFERQ
jgi:hypothetical protein